MINMNIEIYNFIACKSKSSLLVLVTPAAAPRRRGRPRKLAMGTQTPSPNVPLLKQIKGRSPLKFGLFVLFLSN